MEILDWCRSDVRTGPGLTSEPLTVLLGNGVDCGAALVLPGVDGL